MPLLRKRGACVARARARPAAAQRRAPRATADPAAAEHRSSRLPRYASDSGASASTSCVCAALHCAALRLLAAAASCECGCAQERRRQRGTWLGGAETACGKQRALREGVRCVVRAAVEASRPCGTSHVASRRGSAEPLHAACLLCVCRDEPGAVAGRTTSGTSTVVVWHASGEAGPASGVGSCWAAREAWTSSMERSSLSREKLTAGRRRAGVGAHADADGGPSPANGGAGGALRCARCAVARCCMLPGPMGGCSMTSAHSARTAPEQSAARLPWRMQATARLRPWAADRRPRRGARAASCSCSANLAACSGLQRGFFQGAAAARRRVGATPELRRAMCSRGFSGGTGAAAASGTRRSRASAMQARCPCASFRGYFFAPPALAVQA